MAAGMKVRDYLDVVNRKVMEAVRTSETSVCYEITRGNIPEGSSLQLINNL
jgi:hypothetical protein